MERLCNLQLKLARFDHLPPFEFLNDTRNIPQHMSAIPIATKYKTNASSRASSPPPAIVIKPPQELNRQPSSAAETNVGLELQSSPSAETTASPGDPRIQALQWYFQSPGQLTLNMVTNTLRNNLQAIVNPENPFSRPSKTQRYYRDASDLSQISSATFDLVRSMLDVHVEVLVNEHGRVLNELQNMFRNGRTAGRDEEAFKACQYSATNFRNAVKSLQGLKNKLDTEAIRRPRR